MSEPNRDDTDYYQKTDRLELLERTVLSEAEALSESLTQEIW